MCNLAILMARTHHHVAGRIPMPWDVEATDLPARLHGPTAVEIGQTIIILLLVLFKSRGAKLLLNLSNCILVAVLHDAMQERLILCHLLCRLEGVQHAATAWPDACCRFQEASRHNRIETSMCVRNC